MYGAVFFNIYLPLLIKKKKKYHLVKWKIVVYQFNMGNRVCVIWFCLISLFWGNGCGDMLWTLRRRVIETKYVSIGGGGVVVLVACRGLTGLVYEITLERDRMIFILL